MGGGLGPGARLLAHGAVGDLLAEAEEVSSLAALLSISSHHFSHHLSVTGWTSRLRLGLCFRSVSTARYGLLRPLFSFTRWKP